MITIDWPTKVISVPQADLTFISSGVYELDVNQFRLALLALEESEDGRVWPRTHNHNTQVTLSGVTYARTVEIINGYTVDFEAGAYTVRCIGANHNLGDVKTVNSVSLLIGNSSGLILQPGGSAATPEEIAIAVWNKMRAAHTNVGSFGEALDSKISDAKKAAQLAAALSA